jgi:hypothetical protein
MVNKDRKDYYAKYDANITRDRRLALAFVWFLI